MEKAIRIIVVLLLQMNIIFAQNSFEIGSVYSLTAEKLVAIENTSSQLYHSFGINGKKIFQSNVFIHSGIHLRNFGSKFGEEGVIIDDLPSEVGGQSVDIPISAGYYFLNSHKVRLGVSFGGSHSFLRSQYQNHYGYIIETIPMYNDYLFYLNSSIEIGLRLTKNIILDIRPIFQRQINSNFRRSYKQSGIGCQFGISYDFNEK